MAGVCAFPASSAIMSVAISWRCLSPALRPYVSIAAATASVMTCSTCVPSAAMAMQRAPLRGFCRLAGRHLVAPTIGGG